MSEPLVPARPVVVLLGPTAVGKTAAAIGLCRELGGEVISCDSMQVYRGFDVGTAKPGPEAAGVPHHLIDICDPTDTFSAADFVKHAIDRVAEIESRGRLPVIVGGTGLYLRALTAGIFEGPPRVPAIRERLRAEARERGLGALYQRLALIDPEYHARVHENDPVRIIRALEVAEVTGIPLSTHFQKSSIRLQDHAVIRIGMLLPRARLYEQIDRRVESMLAAGLIEETGALLARGVPREATPFGGLGYRQAIEMLDGRRTLAETRAEIQKQTRRYAKRQMTWFRRESGTIWVRADRTERIASLVRNSLL